MGVRENNDCRWCVIPPPRAAAPQPPPPPPAAKGKAPHKNQCPHCSVYCTSKAKLRSHIDLMHGSAEAPSVTVKCGAPCPYEGASTRSVAVHRQVCRVWQTAHRDDEPPPESPPDTGRPQETLNRKTLHRPSLTWFEPLWSLMRRAGSPLKSRREKRRLLFHHLLHRCADGVALGSLLEELAATDGVVTCPAYADDVTVIASGLDAKEALDFLSASAARAKKWCLTCLMSVADEKSTCKNGWRLL